MHVYSKYLVTESKEGGRLVWYLVIGPNGNECKLKHRKFH